MASLLDIQSQITALKRQIQANRAQGRKPVRGPSQTLVAPEWVVRSAENGTYTAGTDWNTNFDTFDTATTNYLESRHPAGGGWVQIGSNSGARGFRARLVFDSESNFTSRVGVDMDSGRVQVQDNGRIQEATANAIIDVQFYKGRNVLECFCDESCIYARFRLLAMDGILCKGVRQVI